MWQYIDDRGINGWWVTGTRGFIWCAGLKTKYRLREDIHKKNNYLKWGLPV